MDNGLDLLPERTAEFMNSFLSKVGENLAKVITYDNNDYLHKLRIDCNRQNNLLISWRQTNREEIENLIDAIDVYKSSMIENISSLLFRDCLLLTIDKICLLFNKILTNGVFPMKWKTACVIPIFKNGSSKQVTNYRPISLCR